MIARNWFLDWAALMGAMLAGIWVWYVFAELGPKWREQQRREDPTGRTR